VTEKDQLSAIHDVEARLTSAELHSDEKTLHELLADKFLGVNLRGQRIDKAAFIAGLCAPGVRLNSLQIEDLDVRFDGETAIAVGKSTFKAVHGETVVHGTARFMDVWKKLDKNWALISSSVTPIIQVK